MSRDQQTSKQTPVSMMVDDVVHALYSRTFPVEHPPHGPNCSCQEDTYNSDYSSDSGSMDDEMYNHYISHIKAKDQQENKRRRPTAEEANKLARQLIEEEQLEKEKEERKKAKKKKKKERQKQKQKDKKPQDDEPDEEERREVEPSQSASKKVTAKEEREAKGTIEKESAISNRADIEHVSDMKTSNQERSKSHSSEDEDSIDTKSAFFARAAGKKPLNPVSAASVPSRGGPAQTKSRTVKPDVADKSRDNAISNSFDGAKSESAKGANAQDGLTPLVRRSRELAIRANKMASDGMYNEAINLFQQAIELDSTDFRFFGNRSFCYERIGEFKCALQDADSAIALESQWPKGHFRKGRSLVGIKDYKAAEQAFEVVIKLEGHSQDALFELTRVRSLMLVEMGFDAELASIAVSENDTFQSALEALLEGRVEPEPEVYWSNDEEELHENSADDGSADSEPFTVAGARGHHSKSTDDGAHAHKSTAQTAQPSASSTVADQRPPMKSCAVWVGNINSQLVTEDTLERLFNRCGRVAYVKILPQKSCAFVNYDRVTDAEAAIEKLQGAELGGLNLYLKFSNNPQPGFVSASAMSSSNTASSKTGTRSGAKATASGASSSTQPECSRWRSTGCNYANQCRFRHVPGNKGIDRR